MAERDLRSVAFPRLDESQIRFVHEYLKEM